MRAHLARANTVRGLVIPVTGGGWAAAVVARDDQAQERWFTLVEPAAGAPMSWDDAADLAARMALVHDLLDTPSLPPSVRQTIDLSIYTTPAWRASR